MIHHIFMKLIPLIMKILYDLSYIYETLNNNIKYNII